MHNMRLCKLLKQSTAIKTSEMGEDPTSYFTLVKMDLFYFLHKYVYTK